MPKSVIKFNFNIITNQLNNVLSFQAVVPMQLLALFSSLTVLPTLGNRKEKQVSTLTALMYRVNGVACRLSTGCALTRHRLPVAEPWRGVAVSATREHTHRSVYSHAYQPHNAHHTNAHNFTKIVHMILSATGKVTLSFTYRRDVCIVNKSQLI
jgi:hypothetical protein